MIQKIKKFIVIGIASLSLLSPALMMPVIGGVASADIGTELCNGVQAAADNNQSCNNANTDPTNGIKGLATKITNIFSVIVGAAAVIMIIYGGFRYITSGGDSGKVGNAKNTLIYAIVGLIIVALAQLIVRFVITQSTDSSNSFN